MVFQIFTMQLLGHSNVPSLIHFVCPPRIIYSNICVLYSYKIGWLFVQPSKVQLHSACVYTGTNLFLSCKVNYGKKMFVCVRPVFRNIHL